MPRPRRPKKRQKNLLKVGDFLPKLLKRKKIPLDILDYRISDAWHRAVGPQISAQTTPSKFKNNTLFVNVSTPAWMQQLRFLKQEIMDKVNDEWGKKEIQNIYFTIGDISQPPVQQPEHSTDFNPRLLKKRDQRLIRENLARIEDEDLRLVLRRVMTKEIIKRRLSE